MRLTPGQIQNTLAYICKSLSDEEKMFLTLTPLPYDIKISHTQVMSVHNKLERSSLASLSSLVLMIVSNAIAYISDDPL
jgi:hypothetical protein